MNDYLQVSQGASHNYCMLTIFTGVVEHKFSRVQCEESRLLGMLPRIGSMSRPTWLQFPIRSCFCLTDFIKGYITWQCDFIALNACVPPPSGASAEYKSPQEFYVRADELRGSAQVFQNYLNKR